MVPNSKVWTRMNNNNNNHGNYTSSHPNNSYRQGLCQGLINSKFQWKQNKYLDLMFNFQMWYETKFPWINLGEAISGSIYLWLSSYL